MKNVYSWKRATLTNRNLTPIKLLQYFSFYGLLSVFARQNILVFGEMFRWWNWSKFKVRWKIVLQTNLGGRCRNGEIQAIAAETRRETSLPDSHFSGIKLTFYHNSNGETENPTKLLTWFQINSHGQFGTSKYTKLILTKGKNTVRTRISHINNAGFLLNRTRKIKFPIPNCVIKKINNGRRKN